MLKIFTIYLIAKIIWDIIVCVCNIIESNKVKERIINSVSIALYCPMLYVLVEMLKML